MKQFNYVRAHRELVLPCIPLLSQKAFELYKFIQDKNLENDSHPNVYQDKKTLLVRFNDGTSLEPFFNEMTDDELAKLSLIAHDDGHWASRDSQSNLQSVPGTYWKVSNLVDQELRRRFFTDIEIHNHCYAKLNQNISIGLFQGKLRLCFSSRDSWLWNEVCIATQENFTKVLNVAKTIDGFVEEREKQTLLLTKLLANQLVPNDLFGKFFNLDEYMDDE